MIKKLNIETFYSNSEKLSDLREALGIKKSDIVKNLKAVGISTIGSSRTYTRLENKELKFSYKTFEDLAKGFNLLFKRDKKTKPKFKATDFYIKDISEDKNSYTRLNKITDSGELINLIFNSDKKKIFGLAEVDGKASEELGQLFDLFSVVSKEEYKTFSSFSDEKLEDFENEKKIIKVASSINDKLVTLNINHDLRLYAGILSLPLVNATFVSVTKNEYKLKAINSNYLIIKFSKNNEDCFDIKYSNDLSLKKLDEILNKYNYEEKFDDLSNWDFIVDELRDRVTRKMLEANDYHYLPFSLNREKIEFDAQEYEEIPF